MKLTTIAIVLAVALAVAVAIRLGDSGSGQHVAQAAQSKTCIRIKKLRWCFSSTRRSIHKLAHAVQAERNWTRVGKLSVPQGNGQNTTTLVCTQPSPGTYTCSSP